LVLLPFCGLVYFEWARKGNKTGFFKDVEDRNPILTGRFHTNISTVIFWKVVRQLSKLFLKGREASLPIISTTVCISDSDTCIDPSFMDIKTTEIFSKDFKHRDPPTKKIVGLAETGRPAKSSQLRKR
jgi:hypothetical protein